ncbi:MAG: hypothetical protein Q8P41_09220, partial [Pseudomonadota bacterium]|nr:hypothetical protein [Pseudomonadota bacterium]
MIALLWLWGCGPQWTDVGALAPTLARMDADRDGRVAQAEYDALAFHGEPFESVDTDKSGALSADELLAIVQASDPASLTVMKNVPGTPRRGQAGKKKSKKSSGSAGGKSSKPTQKIEDMPVDSKRIRSEAQFVVKMILESVRAEVRVVAPNHALPTDDEIKVAAGTSDIRTAECRALLLRMETASDEVGVAFPAGLRAAALAKLPVAESFTPSPEDELGTPARPGVSSAPG